VAVVGTIEIETEIEKAEWVGFWGFFCSGQYRGKKMDKTAAAIIIRNIYR
jgi:hypothetical protein